MIRDELGINIYGSRELSKIGVAPLLEAASTDGIAFVSKFKKPVAMVIPMSVEGLKQAFEKFREMAEIVRQSEKEKGEFEELYEVALKHLNKVK